MQHCLNRQNQSNALNHLSTGQDRPLKIALLGYRSHPHVGGQGIYIRHLSRSLTLLGHEVDVYSGPPYPELDSQVKLIKIPSLDLYSVENVFTALRPKHFTSALDLYEWWSKVSGSFAEPYTFGERIVKRLWGTHYDIIHDNQSLAYGLLKLSRNHQRVVSTIHHPIHRDLEIAINDEKDWFMRALKRRWYSFLKMQEKVADNLENIITVSETSKEDIVKYFRISAQKIRVIHNGVDTNTFRPLENTTRRSYQLITTASSDQPIKGLPHLLKAMSQLVDQFPQLHLNIIGKPKDSTVALIAKLGIKKHVSFSSNISEKTLIEKYAQSSIAVCPSLYEGFGLPLAEAMACGLPVVASNGGAQKEIAGQAALTYPAGDTGALVENIRYLIANPNEQLALGKKGRMHIEKNFSWNSVAEQLSDYYYQILY